MSALNDRLKIARERCGYSQLEASMKVQISNRALSRYETGVSQPDPTTLCTLAMLYEVSTDWLLGLTDEMRPAAAGTSRSRPLLSDELIRSMVKLSPSSKEKLESYVEMLQLLDAAKDGETAADIKKRSS